MQRFELVMIAILVIVATLSGCIDSSNAHIVGSNNTQVWKNTKDNLKSSLDIRLINPL
jgi:hypothetical protein